MGEFIGRFHPLIVHLPVGILIGAFIMELASRRSNLAYLKKSIPFVLSIAIASALVALFTGWIMPKEGEFSERLISLHLWFGVGTTFCSILVFYLCITKNEGLKRFYFPLFSLTMILLTITGHYGGSLTHGEGHLTQPIGESDRPIVTDVNTLIAYPDLIQPLLKSKCFNCHNEGKKKGGLDLSSIDMLMKGGDEGAALVAGSIKESPIIQRLHLPLEDEEHMPPEGKKQFSDNEIALLEWWVAEGASFDKPVGAINQSEEITKILKGYEQSTASINLKGLKPVTPKQLAKLTNAGIQVIPHDDESPLVNVSFNRDTLITKGKLKKLKNISKNISELDLSYTNLDNGMMSVLSSFKNLQKLKIQNTQVSSKGLEHLDKLPQLTYLNLYNTQVDDIGFESLEKLKTLGELFLWKTDVTDAKVENYIAAHPLVKVSYKIDPMIFGDARLKPPIITVDSDLFADTMSVTMSLNFKDVKVYYTLDGTLPDSTSIVYDSTFVIRKTSIINAVSAKEGWTTSEPVEKVLTKVGYKIANAQVKNAPSEKYAAAGARSLIDFTKGNSNFVEGNWLGYEGEDLYATLDLGLVEPVSNVVVSALEATSSYIFFPKGIEVSTSAEGKNYSLAKKINIPIATGPEPPALRSFLLDFDSRDARFIKVKISGTLKNPKWHAAPGAKNWLFVDEILVN